MIDPDSYTFTYTCAHTPTDTLEVSRESFGDVMFYSKMASGPTACIRLSKKNARDLAERLALWTGVTPGAAMVPDTAPSSRPTVATLTFRNYEDALGLAEELVELVRADEGSDLSVTLAVAHLMLKRAEQGL